METIAHLSQSLAPFFATPEIIAEKKDRTICGITVKDVTKAAATCVIGGLFVSLVSSVAGAALVFIGLVVAIAVYAFDSFDAYCRGDISPSNRSYDSSIHYTRRQSNYRYQTENYPTRRPFSDRQLDINTPSLPPASAGHNEIPGLPTSHQQYLRAPQRASESNIPSTIASSTTIPARPYSHPTYQQSSLPLPGNVTQSSAIPGQVRFYPQGEPSSQETFRSNPILRRVRHNEIPGQPDPMPSQNLPAYRRSAHTSQLPGQPFE